MHLCLHRGKGFVSKVILWQTRSCYSHASLLFSDGAVIESRERGDGWKGGVRQLLKLSPRAGEIIDVFEVFTNDRQEHAIRSFAETQVGKPYDYVSIARFMTREPVKDWQMNDWFCSELAFASFDAAGIRLLNTIKAWAVNPGHLSLSTRIHFRKRLQGAPR